MSVYKKKNGKWYFQFMVKGERKHGLCDGAKNKQDAQSIEDTEKFILRQQQNGIIPKREKKIKFSSLIKLYEQYSMNNKKSYKNDIYTLKLLKNYFGDSICAQEILPKNIESFKTYLRVTRKNKNSTINRYLEILSKMFNLGISNKAVRSNPIEGVAFLKEENHKVRFLTRDEEIELFKAIEKTFVVTDKITRRKKEIQPYLYLKPIITWALHTGMRKNEILKCKKHYVNFEQRSIELLETKSGKSRKVPISNKLYKIIEEFFQQTPDSEYLILNPETDKPYVDIKKAFHAVLDIAKIKHFRFHDLRHTAATRMIAGGADLNTVKEILGHSSLAMLQRYVHVMPELKVRAIEILNLF